MDDFDTLMKRLPQGEAVSLLRKYDLAQDVDDVFEECVQAFVFLMHIIEARLRKRCHDEKQRENDLLTLKLFLAADMGANCLLALDDLHGGVGFFSENVNLAKELAVEWGMHSTQVLATKIALHGIAAMTAEMMNGGGHAEDN